MPYFQDQNGGLHFLSDQDVSAGGVSLLPPGCAAIPDAQAIQQQQAAASQPSSPLALALAALNASDRTVLRCVEAGITVPAAWTAYRVALRAVVSGTSTTLPTRPPYPA